jgi:hypothetical protein
MKLVSHGLLGALEELALAFMRWVDGTEVGWNWRVPWEMTYIIVKT